MADYLNDFMADRLNNYMTDRSNLQANIRQNGYTQTVNVQKMTTGYWNHRF